jgi:hypothetical protein
MGMRSIAVKLSLIFGVTLAATILAITLYATLNVRRQAIDNFNDAGSARFGFARSTAVCARRSCASTITSCFCRTYRWSAITQMDDVTQQNAALVEQAATSRSLQDQGRQLDEAVAVFRLKSETAH